MNPREVNMATPKSEESIFPKTEAPVPIRKMKPKKIQHYFVITSDVAYQQKLNAANEKERKLEEKKKKQTEREKKQTFLKEKQLLL